MVGVGFSDVPGGGPTIVSNARCVVDGKTKFQVSEKDTAVSKCSPPITNNK